MARWGIPYQGSKGRYAERILRVIRAHATEADTLVEPFCGGMSVSHCALAMGGWKVKASDADQQLIELLRKLVFEGLPEEVARKWVTRSMFKDALKDPLPDGLSGWEAALRRFVWSFGNGGTSYLYGEHLEEYKRKVHELVVNCTTDDSLPFSDETQRKILAFTSVRARRLAYRRACSMVGQRGDLQEMEAMHQVTRLEGVERLEGVGIERLSVLDYREAIDLIEPNEVLYLDPPYAETAGYRGDGNGFDNAEFWELAQAKAELGARVFVSEYSAPEGWHSVLTFSRRSTMASASNSVQAVEKLYMWRG